MMENERLSVDQFGGEDTSKNIEGDAVWWYDQRFLVWGIDKIKDEEGTERVFWFSHLGAGAG